MLVEQIETANGINDIKLIGETEAERLFIKQLAEAGTLSCLNREVSNTVLFRPISVMTEISSGANLKNSIGKYDFAIRQNEDFGVDLTFKKDSLPIDLTEFDSIKLQVKQSRSATPLFDLSIGSGLEIAGDDDNVLRVSFTDTQTKTFNCQNYHYDVLMIKGDKNEYYLEGKITVRQSITR